MRYWGAIKIKNNKIIELLVSKGPLTNDFCHANGKLAVSGRLGGRGFCSLALNGVTKTNLT